MYISNAEEAGLRYFAIAVGQIPTLESISRSGKIFLEFLALCSASSKVLRVQRHLNKSFSVVDVLILPSFDC